MLSRSHIPYNNALHIFNEHTSRSGVCLKTFCRLTFLKIQFVFNVVWAHTIGSMSEFF